MSVDARFEAARTRLVTIATTGTNGRTATTSRGAGSVAAAGERPGRPTTAGAAGGGVGGVEVGPADGAGPPPQPTVSAANSTHQSGLTDSRTRTGQV